MSEMLYGAKNNRDSKQKIAFEFINFTKHFIHIKARLEKERGGGEGRKNSSRPLVLAQPIIFPIGIPLPSPPPQPLLTLQPAPALHSSPTFLKQCRNNYTNGFTELPRTMCFPQPTQNMHIRSHSVPSQRPSQGTDKWLAAPLAHAWQHHLLVNLRE